MAETITPRDARQPIASNELFVIDVRDHEAWGADSERVPGATHIPAEELDSRLAELPDDTRILVVCPDGRLSADVAERLESEGKDAVSLEGGVEGWRSARLLTQPSPDAAPPKEEGEEPVEGEGAADGGGTAG